MEKLLLVISLLVLMLSQNSLRDEFQQCQDIIPSPTDNPDDCTKYIIRSTDVNSVSGDIVHYRCCLHFDQNFRHHCFYHLYVQRNNEIEYEKRTVVQGNRYYCKDNDYPDSLLQCAYSKSIGPSKCAKNKIKAEDAIEFNGYTYDRCCYVSYENYQICAPFPSDDEFVDNYLTNKHNEGYSSYIVKCGGNASDYYHKIDEDDLDEEITVGQCESIIPRSIGQCTKHTIIESEVKIIDGKRYDKCCFYEVGEGDNSCVVLPNDAQILNDIKKNTRYNGKNKVNLIDCNSNYIITNIIILLIYQLILC